MALLTGESPPVGAHARLLFDEPCPTFLLRSAVLGAPESAPAGRAEAAAVEGRWDEVPSGEATRGARSQ